ncbi:hypothetical protein CL629_03370 [bacterium]|nr:hypothetical protein [bacterium]|tara:strand:+ start:2042 stop:2305 length:264 start_codon:yes stop_codon:yes gene_type:complete
MNIIKAFNALYEAATNKERNEIRVWVEEWNRHGNHYGSDKLEVKMVDARYKKHESALFLLLTEVNQNTIPNQKFKPGDIVSIINHSK